MLELSFEGRVLLVVTKWAKMSFRGPDREDQIADAVSLAWEGFQTAGDTANASSIARYAVRRVKTRRMHSESCRSLMGPPTRCGATKAERVHVDLAELASEHDDPAEIVAMLVDVPAWANTLHDLQRNVLEKALMGDTTQEIAAHLDRSPGRISQIRRELVDSWHDFHA